MNSKVGNFARHRRNFPYNELCTLRDSLNG
jgi:hypothetical protein